MYYTGKCEFVTIKEIARALEYSALDFFKKYNVHYFFK